ncbi:MAG: zf-HC2 domain-containing protein, partial [Propionibacteriaceae bacterium]|nr:zf-HC2 domain-containing protein [Propionibacteriaceae bacterium]
MSRGRDCRRFADDLSGFVDRTLGERRLGQVCQHLAGCASCRETVAGIQALRSRLSSSASPCPPAPASLTERLERIAGGESDEPLYLRAGRSCALPTRSEQLRRRLTRSGAVTVVILATLLGLTLVLGQEPKPVANPVGQAREQYYLSLTAISVDEGVGATMWARERGMSAHVAPVAPRWLDPQPTTPVPPAQAMAVLGRNRHEVT